MAQPNQVTPTFQANVSGASTTVNLRDWLNTRLSPFLKKAIIESLDSEAQYPLQWLGEHLIQQSIMFEGNPDATNIRERFLYDHETNTSSGRALSVGPASTPPTQQPHDQVTLSEPPHAITADAQPAPAAQTEPVTMASPTAPTALITPTTGATAIEAGQGQSLPSVLAVNGTADPGNDDGNQDTEMSNAT